MSRQDLRTLRGQVLLMAGLFLACAVAALLIVSQRPRFERAVRERYGTLSASLKETADAAAAGKLDQEAFTRLANSERLALYDDWMTRADASEQTPRALVSGDPMLYLSRAEKTLLCGNAEQRAKAVKFLALSGSREALPILTTMQDWARRRDTHLASQLSEAIAQLQKEAPETPRK